MQPVWETEPFGARFIAHGLQCVMYRNDMKVWCGYVGVPPTHMLYGIDYSDQIPYPDTWKDRALPFDEHGVVNIFLAALDPEQPPAGYAPLTMVFSAHGGLTYSARLDEFPDLWFFGFDCGHAGDYSPVLAESMRQMQEERPELFTFPDPWGHGVYRTYEYVQGECSNLADQLAAYSVKTPPLIGPPSK